MCGICGVLSFQGEEKIEEGLLRGMCQTLVHRGPDEEGYYFSGGVALGVRRLKVIDLLTGSQPVSDERKRVWVVLNGEIYNFKELRKELESKGHTFKTRSDTETIVHLYEEEGERFTKRLNGMFAIALWDEENRRLLLVRDRLGIKPLYYYVSPMHLLFGSEIKPLLKAGIPRRIDSQALHDYLSYNYIPAPRSIFEGVQKVLPGTFLKAERGRIRAERYWDIPYSSSSGRGEDRCGEELFERLKSAVKRRLVSDVPLGIFLSGGIDSSTLVAMMAEVSGGRIQTFSIGFEERDFSELEEARIVAERFGTDHHEEMVTADLSAIFPELIRYFDEPFADSSAIPLFYLARMARGRVTVALGGDGGDEVFGGYHTYSAFKLANLYRRFPGFFSRGIVPALVHRLPVSHGKISFDFKAKRFLKGALLSPEEGHFHYKVAFDEPMKRELYDSPREMEDSCRIMREHFSRCPSSSPLDRLQYVDSKVYLPDDILVKVDRMTMAHSLEARVPYLDHELVEFMAQVPPELKIKGLKKKYLLKKIMRGILPQSTLRGKKRGFNVPIPLWICGKLNPFIREVLSANHVRKTGLFNPNYIERLIQEHERRRADYSRNIWELLIFQLWHREYMESQDYAPLPSLGEVLRGVR